jgi:hypothetical protein
MPPQPDLTHHARTAPANGVPGQRLTPLRWDHPSSRNHWMQLTRQRGAAETAQPHRQCTPTATTVPMHQRQPQSPSEQLVGQSPIELGMRSATDFSLYCVAALRVLPLNPPGQAGQNHLSIKFTLDHGLPVHSRRRHRYCERQAAQRPQYGVLVVQQSLVPVAPAGPMPGATSSSGNPRARRRGVRTDFRVRSLKGPGG